MFAAFAKFRSIAILHNRSLGLGGAGREALYSNSIGPMFRSPRFVSRRSERGVKRWWRARVAVGCAALEAAIGEARRKCRRRYVEERTDTLVAIGAAGCVIFKSLIPGEASRNRVAARVMSGIGLLGRGSFSARAQHHPSTRLPRCGARRRWALGWCGPPCMRHSLRVFDLRQSRPASAGAHQPCQPNGPTEFDVAYRVRDSGVAQTKPTSAHALQAAGSGQLRLRHVDTST